MKVKGWKRQKRQNGRDVWKTFWKTQKTKQKKKGIYWEAVDIALYPLSALGDAAELQQEIIGWYNEGSWSLETVSPSLAMGLLHPSLTQKQQGHLHFLLIVEKYT